MKSQTIDRIDLSKGTKFICSSCGKSRFEVDMQYELYKFSRFITQTPQDQLVVVPHEGYKCIACGTSLIVNPVENIEDTKKSEGLIL